jgi:hypothetical protein
MSTKPSKSGIMKALQTLTVNDIVYSSFPILLVHILLRSRERSCNIAREAV